jgi:hypothetical protein
MRQPPELPIRAGAFAPRGAAGIDYAQPDTGQCGGLPGLESPLGQATYCQKAAVARCILGAGYAVLSTGSPWTEAGRR